MFLLNKILLSHALDGIIFVVLLVLAKHDLPESPSAQNLQQLKLLKGRNVVFVGLTLENDLAFSLDLFVLLDTLSI